MSVLLEAPPGILIRYYSTANEFASLCETYRKNNALIKEGMDVLTGYPAIIVSDNGRLVFFRASEHLRIFDLVKPIKIAPEPAYFLPASNITIDNEFVRSGENVLLFVQIYEIQWKNITLKIENLEGETETSLASGSILKKGNTEFRWKATRNGTYQIRLKGIVNGTWRELVSSFHIDVIDKDEYLIGILYEEGRKRELSSTEEISSFYFTDNAEFINARNKAVHKAIFNAKQYASVILKDTTNPSNKNGVIRLMQLPRRLFASIINYDGMSRIELPPYAELQRLHAHGITIDRIITSDSLQLIPDQKYYRYCCDGEDHILLDETELTLYNSLGWIVSVSADAEDLYRPEQLRIQVKATLSNYLQVITALQLAGYLFRRGSYSDCIAVHVHPSSFHQNYAWILFKTVPDTCSAKESLDLLFNQGNSTMCIIAPLLSTAAMTNQDGYFESFIDIPGSVLDRCGDLKTFIESNVHLYKPSDSEHPFATVTIFNSLDRTGLLVQTLEHITNDPDGRFFPGSIINPKDQANYVIDPTEQSKHIPESILPISNSFYLDPETRDYAKKVYYRNYPGLLSQCRNIYRVIFSFAQKPSPGLYFLVVENSHDHRVHPVKVFESTKTEYCFCHLTDLHLASRYDEIEKSLSHSEKKTYISPSAVIRKIAPEVNKADFIVITGDAIDFVNEHRPWESNFVPDGNWQYLENLIKECFSIPVFICPGNHDYRANPFPASQYKDDLNISEDILERYPYDKLVNKFGWAQNDCTGDVFFGDANSLQYYHYNFCPFSFFSFSLHKLDFVFVDSLSDQVVFLNDYITKEPGLGLDLLIKLLSVNPPPQSAGISDQAFVFINRSIKNTGILFMHSAIINPVINWPDPLFYEDNLIKLEGWKQPYLPFSSRDKSYLLSSKNALLNEQSRLNEELAKYERTNMSSVIIPVDLLSRSQEVFDLLSIIDVLLKTDTKFNEACITKNKEKIISLLKKAASGGGNLKMIVSGHVHKNLELKYKKTTDGYRWYMGNYSQASKNNSEPLEDTAYCIASISGSVLGYHWKKRRSDIESMSRNMYFMEYHAVGYRMVKLKSDGTLLSMNITEINKGSILNF